MDYVVILLLQIGSAIATLVLISIGLAVIFGMMRVINLAHGEFLMLGGYAAILAFKLGVNLWLAMLVVAPLVVGLIGAHRRAPGHPPPLRPHDRHHAGDLGLSLRMIGLVTMIFGNTVSAASRRRSAASRSAPTRWAATSCS